MKIIKYTMMTEINHGTEEKPQIEQVFNACEIQCADSVFDANYAIAQKEAYNGEITVEEVEDEENEAKPTTEERLAAVEETTEQQGEILSILLSGETGASV